MEDLRSRLSDTIQQLRYEHVGFKDSAVEEKRILQLGQILRESLQGLNAKLQSLPKEREILQRLSFEAMFRREDAISGPEYGTFKWVLDGLDCMAHSCRAGDHASVEGVHGSEGDTESDRSAYRFDLHDSVQFSGTDEHNTANLAVEAWSDTHYNECGMDGQNDEGDESDEDNKKNANSTGITVDSESDKSENPSTAAEGPSQETSQHSSSASCASWASQGTHKHKCRSGTCNGGAYYAKTTILILQTQFHPVEASIEMRNKSLGPNMIPRSNCMASITEVIHLSQKFTETNHRCHSAFWVCLT